MKIISRLYQGFGVLILITLGIAIFGLVKINIAAKNLNMLSQQTAVEQRQAINFRGSVHDRAISLRDAVLVNSTNVAQTHLNTTDELNKFYQEAAKTLDTMYAEIKHSPQEQNLLAAIKEIEKTGLAQTEQLTNYINTNDFNSAKAYLLTDVAPTFSEWLKRINLLIDFQEELIQNQVNTAVSQTNSFVKTMLVAAVIGWVFGSFIAFNLVGRLKRVIGGVPEEAGKTISRMAAGDLTQKITYLHQPSILNSVNQLNTYLIDMAQNSRATSKDLLEDSNQLLSTAANNQQLLNQQQNVTAQGTAAMQNLLASVAEVTNLTDSASALAKEAEAQFNAGTEEVNRTQHSIQQLANQITDAVEVINQLAEDSQQIAQVMAVIEDIADQTNLLALNAAIEAARAGEQGRGFAVVADEVRNLAQRTQESTQQIQQVVEKMQASTNNVVQVMQSGKEQADLSVSQATKAGESLISINEAVVQITNMNNQIALGSNEQAAIADEVNNNFSEITAITGLVEEEANKITSASQGLESLARKLREEAKRFKTK